MISLFLLHFQKNSGTKIQEGVQNKIKSNEVSHVK